MLRPYGILLLPSRRLACPAPTRLFAQCLRKSKEPAGRRRYERRARANSLRGCHLS
jgi:hypothetical protein